MATKNRTIVAPVTLMAGTLKDPKTIKPGESVKLSEAEADSIEARFGKFEGPAPQPAPAAPVVDVEAIKKETQDQTIKATLKQLVDDGLIALDDEGNPIAVTSTDGPPADQTNAQPDKAAQGA